MCKKDRIRQNSKPVCLHYGREERQLVHRLQTPIFLQILKENQAYGDNETEKSPHLIDGHWSPLKEEGLRAQLPVLQQLLSLHLQVSFCHKAGHHLISHHQLFIASG
ncbi:hypothetical protein ElyMa_002882100 [Elysia marginata]|uniref:Uncharacterized protein n=1 Tax=Elysia marginata TaxID=1093978 RepID=A0AAV4HYD8_9GAST|nr:hypothetical protein ElyMa_002882100 [Elysia marginata]